VGEAVGGGVTAAAATAVVALRQPLEHVQDATGEFAAATVAMGEIVAAATVKVASEADFMRIVSQPEVQAKLPKIGVLRCERATFLPAQMSVGSNSYLYTTVQAEVKGLTYADVRAGRPLDAAQTKALQAAIDTLDKLGVMAITGDCGAFVHHQVAARKMTSTPVVLSPLLQAPMLAAMYMSEEKVLVITNDTRDYSQADLEANLVSIGLTAEDAARFVLLGLEGVAGFQAVRQASNDWGRQVNVEATRDALVAAVEAKKAEEPLVRAILIESTVLPFFADCLRHARKVPVFDTITLADYVCASRTDNPRFGVAFGLDNQKDERDDAIRASLPAIGILRIDYSYPPAPGDIDHPSSYHYRTHQEVAKGLTFEVAQAGEPLTEAQRAEFDAAISRLEAIRGVVGITGDCGFLMNYQREARRQATLPCFVSAVMQCHILSCAYAVDEEFLVLTANGESLRPSFDKMLGLAHVTDPARQARFHVLGCEKVEGFDAVAKGEKVDVARVTPGIVALAKAAVAANPRIRAVLLECTELPPYADSLRCELKMPVLDAITLVDFFHSAVTDYPIFGLNVP